MKLLMCLRTGGNEFIVPGCVVEHCQECKHSIWISRATIEVRHAEGEKNILTLCWECVMKRKEKFELQKISPGQRDEIKKFHK